MGFVQRSRRRGRTGFVAGVVVALSTMHLPAAEATTELYLSFLGSATVGAGLAYPCTPATPGTAKCPPTFTTTTKPWYDQVAVNGAGPNTATLAFASSICAAFAVNINKSGKLPAQVGTCAAGGAGTASGYCGLTGGSLTGSVTHTSIAGGTQAYTFALKFLGVGGLLHLTGTVTKIGVGSGPLIGDVVAVPTAGSCLDKGPKTFSLVGWAWLEVVTPL